jgi:hypothetical protein
MARVGDAVVAEEVVDRGEVIVAEVAGSIDAVEVEEEDVGVL